MIRYLSELSPKELEGKRVFLRLDLNVPIQDGQIVDDFRIVEALPVISYLKNHGATLVIGTHLGEDGTASVDPIRARLAEHLSEGDVLLDNLRSNPGEKKNDPVFAGELASRANLYVNDAFAVSHREHASIVGIPKLIPGYAGPLVEKEVKAISRVFLPEHPFVAVIGGAKFSTKIPLVEKLLSLADQIFVVGALANDFFAAQAYAVGASLVSDPELVKPYLANPKIVVPKDVVVNTRAVKPLSDIAPEEKILDIGPESLRVMAQAVEKAKIVVWNGPLGKYEDGFIEATDEFAKSLASSKAFSLLGGGDTLASIKKLNLLDRYGFVSTGGGAMLDYIAQGTLPGLEALKR